MNYLDKTPFAFSGVILGLAALGNLLLSYGTVWRLICGAIALILFIPYTIKLLLDFSGYKEEMKKSLPASVAPTYPMAMMLLATYLTPLLRIPLGISEIIWWIGLIINIAIVIYFIYKFVFKRDINLVYPSWGVVFVGFVVASVTAPVFDQLALGQILFWIGLIGGIFSMPLMLYRTYRIKNFKTPELPAITILGAPFSLLVAGYVNSFPEPNMTFLAVLLVVAQVLYLTTVVQVGGFLRNGFFPTYAALTFPLVISALSRYYATFESTPTKKERAESQALFDEFKENLRTINLWAESAFPKIRQLTLPVFIAQAENDELMKKDIAERLKRVLREAGRVDLHIYEEGQHYLTQEPTLELLSRDIVSFLENL